MISFLKSFSSNIHYKYAVQQSPQFSTGCWSVYDAKNKATGEPVSVMVLSKKAVAKLMTRNGIELRTAMWEEIKDCALQGVQQLTKIRHPGVVKLVEPVEAGKGTLTFVTERLVATVDDSHESDLDELSVVRGLASVVQALQFLHTSIGVVHLNVTPETILVDAQGDWKLMGLEWLVRFEEFAAGNYHLPQRDSRLPRFMHPPYDYLAPELVLHKTVGPSNDVWSLSAVLYYIYLRTPPLKTRQNPNAYRDEYASFRSRLATQAAKFPVKLRPYLDSLFSDRPDGRITLEILQTTDFFQNPLLKALRGIDEYPAKTVEDKVSFLKHLATLLPHFPKQMRLRKIVKFAVGELSGLREPATGLLMGNTLFAAAVDMSALSFSDQVLPVFANLLDYMPFQESVANNIETVVRATSDKDFSKTVLPLFVDALKHHDAQHVGLQTQILKKTAAYCANVTVPKLEQSLFPAVIDCFAATPARAVKVAATESLAVLVDRGVSKALVTDRLIPALQAMKTRDPNVVVAVARLWQTVCPRLDSAQIFTLALPHLLDCAMSKQFTVDQFKQVMTIVQEQIDTVHKNQVKVLVNNQPQDNDDWLNDPLDTAPHPAVSAGASTEASSLDADPLAFNGSAGSPFGSPSLGPPSLLEAAPSSRLSQSANPLKKPEPLPKTPILPSPKTTPASGTASGSASARTVPRLQQSTPFASNNTLTPVPTSRAPPAASSFMAPLVPSNKNTPVNDAPSILTPIRPSKPTPPTPAPAPLPSGSSNDDDFGSFTSSKQFDSLI